MKKIISKLLVLTIVGIMAANMTIVFDGNPGKTVLAASVEELADTDWFTGDKEEYEISTKEQLCGLAHLVNNNEERFEGKTIKLANSIDLNGIDWTPIGTPFAFKGIFDGNGFEVSNISMIKTVNESFPKAGLFGAVEGTVISNNNFTFAEIKNVKVKNVSLQITNESTNVANASGGIGALVGYATNTIIDNCESEEVGIQTNVWRTGGLIGNLMGGTISNCRTSKIDINAGGNTYSGLLCGYVGVLSNKAKCAPITVEKVKVQGLVSGGTNVAGISGFYKETHTTGSIGKLEDLFVESDSNITATTGLAAGIVARCANPISKAVNHGTVIGITGASGITCANDAINGTTPIVLDHCVNFGEVKGDTYAGGLIGDNGEYANFKLLDIKDSFNVGDVMSTGDVNADALVCLPDTITVTITNSYSLASAKDNEGNIIPINTMNKTFSNVYYSVETGSQAPEGTEGIIGQTTAQFKDRTVVEALNKDLDSPVWFQNVDYPDFADNMIPVTELTSDDTASVNMGQEMSLTVSVAPDDATNSALTFMSSDEEIATVDSEGKVKGIKAGEANITITALYDGSQKVCKVTVKDPVADKEKADKEAADKVIEMIKAIDVNKASEAQLKAVQDAYNALTSDQKKLVDANPDAVAAKKAIDAKVEEMEKESGASGTTQKKESNTVAVKKGAKFKLIGYKYTVTSNLKKNPTVTITGYKNKKLKKISVPASVKYKKVIFKVTAIGKNAFKGQKKATAIVIGKNVKTIGAGAFAGNAKCKKINVKTTTLRKVGAKALKAINKKAVIKVPAKKLQAYKKLFKAKGQAKTVKIKK